MAATRTETPALAAAQTGWLLAIGFVALAPLAPHLPGWLAGATLAALVWRGWLAWRQRPLPSRWRLTLLVLAGSAGVGYQFGSLFGQNPGVALLVLFLALKQLETRTVRDGLAIVLLAYFLALAQFFYSQTIPAALATAAVAITATATLLSLTDARPAPAAQLRRAAVILGQALPFMLLLFVLFPRVQGPLWGLPKDAGSGLTGLSDSMAPGAISHLSRSDAIAFRVRFDDAMPERAQLYWRGPVLSEFDGRTWRPRRELPRATLPYAEPAAASATKSRSKRTASPGCSRSNCPARRPNSPSPRSISSCWPRRPSWPDSVTSRVHIPCCAPAPTNRRRSGNKRWPCRPAAIHASGGWPPVGAPTRAATEMC